MSITAVNTGARNEQRAAGAELARGTRLQLIRADRPREQDEGRRFLIVASASRRIARATSMTECFAALRTALVPALADRCTIHESVRRGVAACPDGTRALKLAGLPEGHPLRECARSRSSLLFSTTSSAMLRTLDTCGVDGSTGLAGCVHVLLAPIVLSRRLVVLALLRGFAPGPFDADDLLVAELALSRLPEVLRREGARFHG